MSKKKRVRPKLCCQVNSKIVCKSCGFRQCEDCWNNVLIFGGHWRGSRCARTGVLVEYHTSSDVGPMIIWKEA